MRKSFQIASLLVAALLAVQPALAGAPCSIGTQPAGGCTPDCTMAMSNSQMGPMASGQMATDCSMPAQISSDGCVQNCCNDVVSPSMAQPESAVQSNVDRTLHFVPATLMIAVESGAMQGTSRIPSDSAPPARYILFQVFRI